MVSEWCYFAKKKKFACRLDVEGFEGNDKIMAKAEKLLTASQVADLIGVSVATVHRWTEAGILHASRTLGGHRRYVKEDVQQVIDEQGLSPRKPVQPPRQVLVVSPVAADRALCREVLQQDGFLVVEAGSGHEALIYIAEHQPGSVLLDMSLPVLDGPAVMTEIRNRWPHVHVFALVDDSNREQLNNVLDHTPFSLIKKPLSANVVHDALAAFGGAGATFDSSQSSPPSAASGIRVLIVDDDDLVRKGLEQELSARKDYTVKTAANGYEAGRTIFQFRPNVIVLDLMMDGLNGFDVCKDVRSSAQLKHTKIIILTGYPSDDHIAQAKEIGVNQVLAKPTPAVQICAEIDRVCGLTINE